MYSKELRDSIRDTRGSLGFVLHSCLQACNKHLDFKYRGSLVAKTAGNGDSKKDDSQWKTKDDSWYLGEEG